MEDKYYTHFEHHYTQIIWKPVPEELEALKRKIFKPESNQLNGIVSVSVLWNFIVNQYVKLTRFLNLHTQKIF